MEQRFLIRPSAILGCYHLSLKIIEHPLGSVLVALDLSHAQSPSC